MNEDLSNLAWIKNAITTAETLERLDMLGHDIKIDSEAGVDYTTDPAQLSIIREMWRVRYTTLRNKAA